MPKFVERCRANSSNSVNEPGSSSASIRSRAVILPAACCFSTARSEPAWVASCTRRSRSASLPVVLWMSMSPGTASPALCSSAAVTWPPRRGSSGRSVGDVPDASSRWSDLERPGLDGAALAAALTRDGGLWRSLEVVESIGSTNAELLARAAAGAPEGAVLVAEHQETGRGRLDRSWVSPPRAGLTVSLLVRPDVPAARRGWLPLLTGVALAESVGELTGVRASLKWPNDLLALDGRKLAGILAEVGGGAVVVGTGLNVNTDAAELPDTGTSLSVVTGSGVDRTPVLLGYLRALERRYRRWTEALGDPVSSGLAADYLTWSSTVGTTVSVTMPDGSLLEGVARAVDWDGRLVITNADGEFELASGDVQHVRGRA